MWTDHSGPVEQALSAAFEQHYLPLLRLCVLLTGSKEEGEDLAQEAFVRCAPRLGILRETDVFPYLRVAALNHWKNRLRHLALQRRKSTLIIQDAAARGSTTSTVEERSALWQAITALPKRQRACLVLRYYEDLSEEQTATILETSVGSVKSHTHRALARLQKEYDDGT